MAHSFKRMLCTHGVTQESHREGRRNYDSCFTGCEAGFLVRTEQIAVDSLHNYKMINTIYDSYCSAKSMPMSPEICSELCLLKEMNSGYVLRIFKAHQQLPSRDNPSRLIRTRDICFRDGYCVGHLGELMV
ncbi:Hypothetical protein PHPALM_8857 [Phytophthora palmivora]|uniref:Uncharacterized protein n=1 Tax=Phytophthora palmivora TaxID=4796 RepID=A0A2P4Y8T7_9STRA|nr:Hypothetical protein PHPALM_8857 [Phytophthora palmivora]